MATIPRAALDYVTEQVNGLSADAQAKVLKVLQSIEWTPDNIAECRDIVIQALQAVLPTYTDAAAQAGADLYDAVREASVGEVLGAKAVSGYDPDAVSGAVRAIVQDIVDEKPVEQFNRKVLERVDYDIRRAENVSVAENAARDPLKPKYARIPTGSETCEFCIMLASRGFVYSTAEAASHAHAGCDCRVVQGYDGMEVDGYDPDTLYDEWKNGRYSNNRISIDASRELYSGIGKDHVATIEQIVDNSDGRAKSVYLLHESLLKDISPMKDDSAFFSPKDGHVHLNIELEFSRTDVELGDTWFHEIGHNIDFLQGEGGGWYSSSWRGGLFQETIRSEAKNYLRSRMDDSLPYIREMVLNGDPRDIRSLWYDFGAISEETYESYILGEVDVNYVMEQVGEPQFRYACKMFAREISALPSQERNAISDIIGGATNNLARNGYGHRDSYWDYYGVALANEAFAEMFAGSISSPRAMSKLREYLPESCRLFEEMLGDMINGVMPDGR